MTTTARRADLRFDADGCLDGLTDANAVTFTLKSAWLVLRHWQETLRPDEPPPDPLLEVWRLEIILRRLAAGFSLPELVRAIDGCAGSDFHRQGPEGLTGIGLICRDARHVYRFMAIADGTDYPPPLDTFPIKAPGAATALDRCPRIRRALDGAIAQRRADIRAGGER